MSISNNLREIHQANHIPYHVSGFDKDKLRKFLLFRTNLLEEELNELKEANRAEDVVDALIDLAYVALGTLDLFNIDIDKAWDKVHSANMEKKTGVKKGRPNPFGLPDLVKPEGWKEPNHEDNVGFIHDHLLPIKDQETESVNVLNECIDLQKKKSQDYQNTNSSIKQSMHYRRGIDSIHDLIWGKVIRAQSLIESGNENNFEPLEDSYKDCANYCSFAVSYLRYKMNGQDLNKDLYNNEF